MSHRCAECGTPIPPERKLVTHKPAREQPAPFGLCWPCWDAIREAYPEDPQAHHAPPTPRGKPKTMHCDENGISLTKREINAILEFTAKSVEAEDWQNTVQFTAKKERCFARASDGHKSVEVEGESDAQHHDGTWLVMRDFLAHAGKALRHGQGIRLAFSGASLHDAIIEESGCEVARLSWEKDAAFAQGTLEFPDSVGRQIKIPHASREVARCASAEADYYGLVALVGRACTKNRKADFYPPKSPADPLVIQVGAGDPTFWTIAIIPATTDASATGGKTNGQKERTKRKKRAAKKPKGRAAMQQELGT